MSNFPILPYPIMPMYILNSKKSNASLFKFINISFRKKKIFFIIKINKKVCSAVEKICKFLKSLESNFIILIFFFTLKVCIDVINTCC